MELESVNVHVLDDGGHQNPGRIDRLWHTPDGVSMRMQFPAGEGPALPLGRAAHLQLSGGPYPESVEVAGLVTSRFDDLDADTYHMRFAEASYPVLGVLFERRTAPRVPPSEDQMPQVALRRLEGGANPVACKLIDVSEVGLGLQVSLKEEKQFATSCRVRIAMALPDNEPPIVLDGEIRHRGIEGDDVVYGVEFQGPRKPDDSSMERIARYVSRRLDELRSKGKLPSAVDPAWEALV